MRHTVIAAAMAVGLATFVSAGDLPSPPGQPLTGPGGSSTVCALSSATKLGSDANAVWIFSPDGPKPAQAPVVMFLHGWSAVDPNVYGAWISHLVHRGYTVVYPVYQSSTVMDIPVMFTCAQAAIAAAWQFLETDPSAVRPMGTTVAWLGHSLGGFMAPDLAAISSTMGLPPPGAIFLVAPGGNDISPVGNSLQLQNLELIPSSALVACIVGESDHIAGDGGAIAVLSSLTQVPAANQELVTVNTDVACNPPLIADHFACCAFDDSITLGFPATASFPEGDIPLVQSNALDFYGYWKLSDALLDTLFFGIEREFVFGGTLQETFMGLCSDGTPVPPLTVSSQ